MNNEIKVPKRLELIAEMLLEYAHSCDSALQITADPGDDWQVIRIYDNCLDASTKYCEAFRFGEECEWREQD